MNHVSAVAAGVGSGRHRDHEKNAAFQKLIEFIDSSDECQFIYQDFEQAMGDGEKYSQKALKPKLMAHYGKSLFVTETPGKENVYNFSGSASAALYEKWYDQKKASYSDERMRIVETAAAIIREDIRSKVYSTSHYPSDEKDLDDESVLPKSLHRFMEVIITTKAKDKSQRVVQRKRAAIGQALVAACRPRSFLSPILLAVGVFAHRNFGSRELVSKLSNLCFSVDYAEVRR